MLNKYELIEIKDITTKKCDYNPEMVYDFQVEEDSSYNVNSIAVHNSACITRNKTGFYRPCGSTVLECSESTDIPIIADGGIREHGDIAKSLVLCAHMSMAGSLFAGYDQSAGEIVEVDGRLYKEYFGNASEFTKNNKKHIEGKKILEPYKGNMKDLLIEIKQDLQSSISYCGGRKLYDLRRFKDIIFI